MIETTNTMPIEDRRELVLETLRPDEIRNHRVADGLELSTDQTDELNACASSISAFAEGMSEISNIALAAPSSDSLSRKVRSLLGTEGLYQAQKRGEITSAVLAPAEITKADIVITEDGFRIVEIEPGKIRGLGYGVMARMQSSQPIGVGAETTLGALTGEMDSAVLLSERDKFHVPEMKILARAVGGLQIREQMHFKRRQLEDPVEGLIMMSPLVNNYGITEEQLRRELVILSDRRLDLESKGAIAILHNSSLIPELEDLLIDTFGSDQLTKLRNLIPKAEHISLDDELAARLEDAGSGGFFLKPVQDSGTRGIITPGDAEGFGAAISKRKILAKYVAQRAVSTVLIPMHSMDVRNGSEDDSLMNIRITVHTNRDGNIIEATVVGSPHEHLAHGGKTSVITNIEAHTEAEKE